MMIQVGIKSFIISALLASVVCHANSINDKNCTTEKWSLEDWRNLEEQDFELSESILKSHTRAQLVEQLRFCLAHPDPSIRDGVAYFGFAHWLRSEKIHSDQLKKLFETLLQDIEQRRNDDKQVYLPFAVLALSEVVRVDRVHPYLSGSERQSVIDSIGNYLEKNEDFRGYNDTEGWRHAVAHSADVLLQLVLNQQVNAKQLKQIFSIIEMNLNPSLTHFYHFGEPERLARPIIYGMLRDEVSEHYWQQWLTEVSNPGPLSSWEDAYSSEAGLAKKHNVKSFLLSLYATVSMSENADLIRYKPFIERAIKKVR